MKLKQLFEEEMNNLTKNNYYNIVHSDDFNSSTFSNKDTLYNIFREIMATNQKEGVDFEFLDLIKHDKKRHSFSVFLIGLKIFAQNNLLNTACTNKIEEIRNKIDTDFKITFEYIWLMVCLYHDLGSSLEQNPEQLFRFKTKSLSANIQFYFPHRNVFDIVVYKNNWRRYFNYRLSKSVLDHGILGGLLFYTELKKKYKELRKDKPDDFFITHNNIGWSKKLLEQVHGYVAWIIISHNMWFINESDEEKKKKEYKDNKLDELIIKNEQRLFIDSDPFLFLLCLIDSIDPIKKLVTEENSVDKILKEIEIEINKDKIMLGLLDIPEQAKEKYIEAIKDLEKWLGVRVRVSESESVSESTDRQIITIEIEDKAIRSYKC